MRIFTWVLLLGACTSMGKACSCAGTEAEAPKPEAKAEAKKPSALEAKNINLDAPADQVTAKVRNPVSGADVAIYLSLPSGAGPFPAIVAAPRGFASGYGSPPESSIPGFLEAGFAVVRFDPDGRGNSSGTEDKGGKAHQAATAEVIRWAIAHEAIADDRVGVLAYSNGLTMAVGALVHHDTGARFLVDWEGPSSRKYTAGCGLPGGDRPDLVARYAPCEDEAFWADREAVQWIGDLTVPYQRIQWLNDHAHGGLIHDHAVELVQAAIDGGVPWVRLNDLPPNTAPAANVTWPQPRPSERDDWTIDYVVDALAVAEGKTPEPRRHESVKVTPQKERPRKGR